MVKICKGLSASMVATLVLMNACTSTDENPVVDFDDKTVRKLELNANDGDVVWEPHLALSANGASVAVAATYGENLSWQYIWSGRDLDNWTGSSYINEETSDFTAGDPVVQFGTNNTSLYTYLFTDPAAKVSSVKLARSTDGGKTYSHQVSVVDYPFTQGNISVSPDKEWMAVDRNSNTIYVAWSEFTIDRTLLSETNPAIVKLSLCLSRSVDGGTTFLPYQVVDSTPITGQALDLDVHVLQVVVDKQGIVHLLWRDPATAQLLHSYSTNAGVTFSAKIPVAGPPADLKPRTLPSLAVTESNQLVATWVTKGGAPKEFIEYSVYSSGTSWSAPQRMAAVPSVDQSCPAIAAGSGGVYILCFEVADKELSVVLYRSSDLTSFQKVHTFSKRAIGYENFETDTKPDELLTGNTFRPGDYVGLAVQGNTVWTAYTLPVTSKSLLKSALYIGKYQK